MSNEDVKPAFQRSKRPLLLAICGICMMTGGATIGSFLTSPSPDTDQGKHSTPKQFPRSDESVEELGWKTPDNDPAVPAQAAGPLSTADRIATYVQLGDESLRVGDYSRANGHYRHVLNDVSGDGEASVRFRLALSAECSGANVDAMEQYQHIIQKFSTSRWSSAAQLGRVRCLAAGGRAELLDATIYRTMILDPNVLTPAVFEELLHIAARSLTERLLRENHTDLLDDRALVMPVWDLDPHEELAELNRLLKAATPKTQAPALEVIHRIDDHPDSINLRVHSPRVALRNLLTKTITAAGLTVGYSETAEQAIENRRQEVHADDIRLSLLLDGLTVPFGLLWTMDGQSISILTTDEAGSEQVTAFNLQRTERLLELARVEAPTSRQVAHTRMAHGCLLFNTGREADAVHVFSGQVDAAAGGTVGTEAAFNLAKCYLALGRSARSEASFYLAVDSAGQQRATGAAGFLYIGRIQLEDARFHEAAASLRRALALANGTSMEQHAAAMLGCAYLLKGEILSANKVFADHKSSMTAVEVRNSVAFASALARFRSAVLPDERERQARDVLAALTKLKLESAFGSHWEFLAGEACDELGFTMAAMRHYANVTKAIDDTDLKGICLLRLAERYRTDQRFSDATELLKLIQPDQAGSLNHEVALQRADMALENSEPAATIEQCRLIVTDSEDQTLRRRALHLMGRAFERQGDRRSAIYCFAGMLPKAAMNGTSDQKANQTAADRDADHRENH